MRKARAIFLYACLALISVVIPRPAARLFAATPNTRYIITDATVKDTKTGLEWQRELNTTKYTPAAATAYCAGTTLPGAGWRLPTFKELFTLIDYSRYDPAIDLEAFPDTPSETFCSSNSRISQVTLGYYHLGVSMKEGAGYGLNETDSAYARCVR